MRCIPLTGQLFAVVLLLVSFGAQAELFKWVDENGKTHYSDKDPGARAKSKAVQTIEQPGEPENQPSSARVTSSKLPQTAVPGELYLGEIMYLWKRAPEPVKTQKIGSYHIGKGCTSRGAIKVPSALIRQPELFANEGQLKSAVFRLIRKLGYKVTEILTSQPSRVVSKKGFILQGEIIDMNLKACAPGITDFDPNIGSNFDQSSGAESIHGWKFTKHRLQLKVNWTLKSAADDSVVFQTTSVGKHSYWKHKHQYAAWMTFAKAMESATRALLVDQAFTRLILRN